MYYTDKQTSPRKTYYFATRAQTGYSSALGTAYLNGVNVHYYRDDSDYSHYITNLNAGESFTAPLTGVTFTCVSATATSAVLRICKSGNMQLLSTWYRR